MTNLGRQRGGAALREGPDPRVAGARLVRVCDRGVPVADAQERFLVFAAHELRGSIALPRAVAEVALADPGADTSALRGMGEAVVAACERQERLLEALLTLFRSESGRLRRQPVDLAATAAEVLRSHDLHGLRSTAALTPARAAGDPQLVERLIANL